MSVARIWRLFPAFLALCSTNVVHSDSDESRPDYGVYHNLSAVNAEVATLARNHPTYVRIEPGFNSRTNLSWLVVRVANFSNATGGPENPPGSPMVRALLLFGVRGGELVTVESALHLLRKLLETPGQSGQVSLGQTVLSKLDLHIVVMANPDARARVERTGDFCSDATRGTNLDAPLFGSERLDEREKTEEAETMQVLANLSRAYTFDAVVAFRSAARGIRLPFAPSPPRRRFHRVRRHQDNGNQVTALAEAVSGAANPRLTYRRSSHPPLLRFTNGKPFDPVRKVPFSLVIGLWDGGHGNASHCFRQLNPASTSLARTLEELSSLYEALFLHLVKWKESQSSFASKWKSLIPFWLKLGAVKAGIVALVAGFFCWRRRTSEYTKH